ncbi:MAG TPA: F0F1 ATP synthase subunit epsilon [Rhizomicrobium sp.]|jgi:F-type H+-transporting ATPase subunit epsilon|nr:F0F1 ATP synthase subunit epsilon [Rhizomicrobium sp.]
MADKIAFDIVSPERLLLSDEADMVTVPGADGEFGVLAGHMPLISTLRPGVIDIRGGGVSGDSRFFVLGGFAEVNATKITILAEEAIPIASIDAAALDQRIRNTEEDLGLAKTEPDRTRVAEQLDHLRQLHAAL